MTFLKTNSKKAASILNWALLKEDTINSPLDPGKPALTLLSLLSTFPLYLRGHALRALH